MVRDLLGSFLTWWVFVFHFRIPLLFFHQVVPFSLDSSDSWLLCDFYRHFLLVPPHHCVTFDKNRPRRTSPGSSTPWSMVTSSPLPAIMNKLHLRRWVRDGRATLTMESLSMNNILSGVPVIPSGISSLKRECKLSIYFTSCEVI